VYYLKHVGFLGAAAPAVKGLKLMRLDQANQTDLSLLRSLTLKYGLTLSIKAGENKSTIVITNLDLIRSRPPVLTILRSDCTDYTFNDFAGLNTKGRYARYFDPIEKKLVEYDYERLKGNAKDGLLGSDAETLEGKGQQDRAVVREALGVFAKKKPAGEQERAAELAVPGNPSLIAGAVVELPQEEWLGNDGIWTINKSTHEMTVKGGYKTTLKLGKPK
jgi:phage protein D